MIIDAHLHLPCDDSLNSLQDKKQRLLSDMKKAGVDACIVLSDSEEESPIGTPEECVALFQNTPNVFIIGGISPLIAYEERIIQLEGYLKQGKIIALKLYPGHEAFYMDHPALGRVVRLCLEFDVPLAVHTGWSKAKYNNPHYFARLAEEHPALKMVICHLYWPDIEYCYQITGQYKNVFYDVSSLAHEKALLEMTRRSLSEIANAHPEKMMLGSDYGACRMEDHIDLVKSLSVSDQVGQRIFWKNARDIYKLPIQ